MKKFSWATPLMILIASITVLILAPFAIILAVTNVRDAKDLGIDLKLIAESIVSMSKPHVNYRA